MTTSIHKKKEDFEKRKKEAKILIEHLLDEVKPTPIYLMDIDKVEYADKKIVTEVMVCAKDEVYHVPKVFEAECKHNKCPISSKCPYSYKKRRIHIACDRKELIDFTRLPDHKIGYVLNGIVPCEFGDRGRITTKIIEKITVQDLLVIPKVTTLKTIKEDDKELVVDELGREYRDKQVFALQPLPKTNEYFRVTGWVKSNPKNQISTLLITDLEPLNDDFQNFKITKAIVEDLRVFQVPNGSTIEAKIDAILTDLTNNVTKIYGEHRKRMLLSILLAYHSVISFKFDKEVVKRGWVEINITGDTGQGKTQSYELLQKHIGLGAFISGTSARRTGVAYAWLQFSNTWYLKWGIYALCDGKLLFVDEGQCIKEDEWNKLSSGRSDGKITATGVKSGEHYTRTRLIISCNPKDNAPIDESMCGVSTLKAIYRPADIRRFDLAVFLSCNDQNQDVIDVPSDRREQTEQIITAKRLYNNICKAWTRLPKHIEFTPEAIQHIYDVTRELKNKYEKAIDIPLITSDARHKVARLAVALACLLHSTDETNEMVIVTEDHVEYMKTYMMGIYDHDNCSLNIYASLRKDVSTLSEEDYQEVLKEFRDAKGYISDDIKSICLEFASNDVIERSYLADILDLTADNVSNKLKIFKDLHLIKSKSGKRGYKITAKFKKVLKRMLTEGLLEK
jgi:hypothetical protein